MDDHVLHVGIRVDHMPDGGSLHCDGLVLLSVEVVGKIEKLHADAAGDGGEEGEEVGGYRDPTTCDAKHRATRRESRPGGQRKRRQARSAS